MVGQRPRYRVWVRTSHRPQYCVRIMSVLLVLVMELMWLCVGVYTQSPGEGIFRMKELSFVYAVFLVHPTSIAAIDGSTVEFTCTANNSEDIDYRINGTLAGLPEIADIGLFEQLSIDTVSDMTLRRNISVTVSSLYNNTEISCRSSGTDTNVNSNTATLTVQGNTYVYDNQQ